MSLRLCSLLVLLTTTSLIAGEKRGEINFSVIKTDTPPTVQSKAPISQGRKKADIDFSVNESRGMTEPTGDINFSIIDVPDMEKETGDAPDKKLMCRRANRVLVIYHSEPIQKTAKFKVCVGGICHWETRVVGVQKPDESLKFIGALKAMTEKQKTWRCGVDADDHFRFVDYQDPKNANLVKEMAVAVDELPLMLKETSPDIRKRASGLSGNDATQWWNKQFQERNEPSTSGPIPSVGEFLSGPNWDYHGQGSLRDHLTDMNSPHHLPKAVVDSWSDAEVQAWHNWHHEELEKRKQRQPTITPGAQSVPVKKVTQPVMRKISGAFGYSQHSHEGRLVDRIAQVAQSQIQSMPSQVVQGMSKKKQTRLEKTGLRTNVVV